MCKIHQLPAVFLPLLPPKHLAFLVNFLPSAVRALSFENRWYAGLQLGHDPTDAECLHYYYNLRPDMLDQEKMVRPEELEGPKNKKFRQKAVLLARNLLQLYEAFSSQNLCAAAKHLKRFPTQCEALEYYVENAGAERFWTLNIKLPVMTHGEPFGLAALFIWRTGEDYPHQFNMLV